MPGSPSRSRRAKQQEPSKNGEALPDEWLAALTDALRANVHESQDVETAALLRRDLLRCVEALHLQAEQEHAEALESQRAKSNWQVAILEKQLHSQRRAGSVEGEQMLAKVEAKHQEAIAQLQERVETVEAACNHKLAKAEETEKKRELEASA